MTKKLNPKNIFFYFLAAEALILLLDFLLNTFDIFNSLKIRMFFNISGEWSLGSFFSSFQLLFIGLVLFLIFKKEKEPSPEWILFGLFFVYLSIDDLFSIHENLGSKFKGDYLFPLIREMQGLVYSIMDKINTWGWHFSFGPVYACIGLLLFFFLKKELNDKKAVRYLFLGLSLWVIAMAIDYIEGIPMFLRNLHGDSSYDYSYFYHAFTLTEESLEMLGASFIIYSLSIKLFSR